MGLWLEKISYLSSGPAFRNHVDSFYWASSDRFERGSVCPRLQNLKMPDGFAQDLSATALKLALAEGSTRSMQLKWIPFSFCVEDGTLVLMYFEMLWTRSLSHSISCPWFPSLVSNSNRQDARRPIVEN